MSTAGYALQFLINEREYAKLLAKVNDPVRDHLPKLETFSASSTPLHNYVRRHIRLYLRVWLSIQAVNQAGRVRAARTPLNLPAGKIGTSITSISALYRLAYLILNKIKAHLPGQKCNLVPVLSGLVAGSAFALFPKEFGRTTIALYVLAKAVEFIYNWADDSGYLAMRPQWMGSWILMPFSIAQLFHTFIFHPDCCPALFKRFMMTFSQNYIPIAPLSASSWPSPDEVVASIAQISVLRYPKFASPVITPASFKLPPSLSSIEQVVVTAHPTITTFTSAVMHPDQPSELAAFTGLVFSKFTSASKYLFAFYALAALAKYKSLKVLVPAAGQTVKTTLVLVMTAATCWSGVNTTQNVLQHNFLPLYRYRLIGLAAGAWAVLDMHSRARYMYVARLAVKAHWDVLVKQGRVKPIKNGEVLLFAAAFAAIMGLADASPSSVSGAGLRKCLHWVKTGDFIDPAVHEHSD